MLTPNALNANWYFMIIYGQIFYFTIWNCRRLSFYYIE
jgi:hypothetical protein